MMLSIDFGTSNSAAALVDRAGQLQVITLEQHNSSMPTGLGQLCGALSTARHRP